MSLPFDSIGIGPARQINAKRSANVLLTQLAADILSIISQGEKSVSFKLIAQFYMLYRQKSSGKFFSRCPTSTLSRSTKKLRMEHELSSIE